MLPSPQPPVSIPNQSKPFSQLPLLQARPDLLEALKRVSRSPPSSQQTSSKRVLDEDMRKAFAPARQPAPLQGGRQSQPRAGPLGAIATASAPAQALTHLEALSQRQAVSKRLPRRWQPGQVYAPHDLSSVEASKHGIMRRTPPRDVFDLAAVNPIHHYKNFALLSQFVTETGRIKGAKDTGLRPVNQRRIAKAVRRAVGLGLMPSVYKHPEILGMQVGVVREVGGR